MLTIETQRTKRKKHDESCEPVSIERGVRQLLANKVSGNLTGIWLAIPEHLRLGAWDLLNSWNNNSVGEESKKQINLRLAMHLINEASLCARGIRQKRTLSQKGFELANGLPFVASDKAIHHMLDTHTVLQSLRLQIALGKIRLTLGHFRKKKEKEKDKKQKGCWFWLTTNITPQSLWIGFILSHLLICWCP
jgi:hypothetical protein